jgi:MAP/microtubule affinity-regulating kinase
MESWTPFVVPHLMQLRKICATLIIFFRELFQGKRYTGPEVDVWSCGVILYVLTTGCLPFDGNNLQEMRESVTRGKYRIPFYLSEGCEKLLRKFLVRDPMKRPSLDILIDDEWLNEGYDAPPISFDVKEELTGEDPLVLNIMESKFGVPKYDIIKGLHDNEYSENLAIYFLLYDEKIKNGDAAVAKIAEAMSIKAPVQQATPQPEQKHGAPVPAIEPIAEETSVEELKKPKEAIPAAQAPYVSRRRASISQEPKLPPPAPSSGASKKDTENIPANAAIPQVATRVNVVNTPAKRQRRATVTGNSDRPQFDPVASGEQQKEAKPKEKKPSAGTPAVEPTNASPANEEKIEVVSRAAPVPGNRNRRFSIAVTTEQYVPSIPESVVPSLKIEGDSKEKQPEKKKSSIIGFLKFGRKSGDEASNGAADKPNKEEKSVLQDNTDLKPRSLRFTFASNTTSSKSPDHMIQEVITAATKHGYKFRLVHNFLIECVASPPNNLPGAEHVKIEIEVCKLPRLTRLHGFRFQRISGASADYKTVCEKLLASIQL